MRWAVTIRGHGVELRGYIDAPLSGLGALADAANPLGIMIASPADDDYNPFDRADDHDLEGS